MKNCTIRELTFYTFLCRSINFRFTTFPCQHYPGHILSSPTSFYARKTFFCIFCCFCGNKFYFLDSIFNIFIISVSSCYNHKNTNVYTQLQNTYWRSTSICIKGHGTMRCEAIQHVGKERAEMEGAIYYTGTVRTSTWCKAGIIKS